MLFSRVQWLGHLVLLFDTFWLWVPSPTLFPLLALPSWCLGVGGRREDCTTHSKNGTGLAAGPLEIQSSRCERNLMACPHPAPDEITSDAGRAKTNLLMCRCGKHRHCLRQYPGARVLRATSASTVFL